MDMNYKGRNVGGRGWAGWSGVKGRKWDNCNSIINKYIFKKIKEREKKNTIILSQLIKSRGKATSSKTGYPWDLKYKPTVNR